MRISYFREFVILSKCLNFSHAAKQLHMTQPGLSRHISRIEEELGIKLFKRDTHRVELTESGEQFLSGIEKIIDNYDFLCESVTKKGLERITIGVPYYGVERYLSHIISPFKAAYPKVEIDYLPAYPDEIIAGLLSMRVDVAVLPKVDFLDSEKLVFHDAFEEPVVLMLNRQHPLAAKKGVKISVLKNENFISLKGDFGDALIKALRNFFHQLGFDSPQKTTEAESIEAAALNMKQDSGVMILPGHLKKANISGNIKFIPVLDDNFHLTICLVHHPSNRKPMTEKFIRHYLDQAYGKIET